MARTRLAASSLALAAILVFGANSARAELCFNAVIDGIQAGTGSPSTGVGKFILNDGETELTFKVTYTPFVTTETAAHIHSDAEGGAALKALPSGLIKVGAWKSTDAIPMTPARVANLKAGLMYVNIHSVAFPNGEIKGQILPGPCQEQCFVAQIDGAATGTPGTGVAKLALNHTETELAYWIDFVGLTAPETAAHIHNNAEGGAAVRPLNLGSPKVGIWKYTDAPALTAARVTNLKAGLMYVNIHTTAFPNGEIDGDIVPSVCSPECFAALLDGPTAGTPSNANGTAHVFLSHAADHLSYFVATNAIVNETEAHIHNQNEGGAAVVALLLGPTKSGEWDSDDLPPLSVARVGDLRNSQMYVNVHTTAYPDGEIRGQLYPIVCSATGVTDKPKLRTVLFQNYPNPFNPTTTIAFTLERSSMTRLDVYDVAGRLVTTLVHGVQPAGRNQATWTGRDDGGRPVASGVYFYRMVAGSTIETRKMVLMK